MKLTREILGNYLMIEDLSDSEIQRAFENMGIHAEGISLFQPEIPENRPDLMSFLGLARTLGAALGRQIREPDCPVNESCCGSIFEHADVDTPSESCLRFSARMAVNCRMIPSPDFLQRALRSQGMIPRNCVQDLAAWVSLEYGVPVQVLDARTLPEGSLLIRDAFPSEEAGGIPLPEGFPVFSDENYELLFPVGWQDPDLPPDAAEVLLCSGVYDSAVMSSFSPGYQMDPLATVPALNRLGCLMQRFSLGEILDGIIDSLNYVPQPRYLPFPQNLSAEIAGRLQILGFREEAEGLRVPSFRQDIREHQDLLREIDRLKACTEL